MPPKSKWLKGIPNLVVGVPLNAVAKIAFAPAIFKSQQVRAHRSSKKDTIFKDRMVKENPLSSYLSQLNQEYNLSTEFKSRIAGLIERLSDLSLAPDQIEALAGKVRDTYERQVLVEACREESKKSLEKIQSAINAYSNALSVINQRLSQAETTLENVLKTAPPASKVTSEIGVLPFEKEKAKALMAFACLTSKNSRIH